MCIRDRLGLDTASIETLLDAEVESDTVSYLPLIEASIEDNEFARSLANWFINIELPHRRTAGELADIKESERVLFYKKLHILLAENKLSSTNAKALIVDVLSLAAIPEDVEMYAKEKGYIQVSDESAIAEIVAEVLKVNSQAAHDVKNGEEKAIGFLVGQVMKESKGKANPKMAQALIRSQLGIN